MTAVYQPYIAADRLPLFQRFLSLIRRRAPEERLSRLLDAGPIQDEEWEAIVRLAERHQVMPILYANAKRSDLWDRLPAASREKLRNNHMQWAARDVRLRHKLIEVVDLLEGEGIEAAPFKGPVLTRLLYDDRVIRPCHDLDLLIPREAAGAAWDALTAAGYSPLALCLMKNQFVKYTAFDKEFDFVDAARQVTIDLHWRLTMDIVRPFDYAFCRNRLRTVDFHGRAFRCLSDEDMVVYLCLHGAYDLWASLGPVLWLAEYIDGRRALDWDLVIHLADDLRRRRMLLWGLFLAMDLFDVDPPDRVIGYMEQDRVVLDLAGDVYHDLFGGDPLQANRSVKHHIERRVGQIPRHLKARRGLADKIRYLMWMLFWPGKREWLLLPLPAGLSFLYILFRPLRMAVEIIQARIRR